MKENVIRELSSIVGGDRSSIDPATLITYSYDAGAESRAPELVVWPKSEEEVSGILRIAYREGVEVCCRGAGSGRAGGAVPERGGIVISFEQMNRILEIDKANRQVVTEPGVFTSVLKEELLEHGLFYPPDPASSRYSSIGGNVATSAGGLACIKYGTTKDYVMALRVVLAGGEIISVGSKSLKSVTGYDLVRLFVGSEGTLGAIVRIRLRLLSPPPGSATLLAEFPSSEAASGAVLEIVEKGPLPSGLEFADRGTIETVREYTATDVDRKAGAILLIQVDTATAAEDIERLADLCRGKGASSVRSATDPDRQEEMWDFRRAFSPATNRAAKVKIAEDIAVPIAVLPDALERIYRVGRDHQRKIICYGHAGDGNIHVNLLTDDRADPEIHPTIEGILRAVLDLGGTISGEHGIGLTKAKYIGMEIGRQELDLMRRIKQVFDPKGILNPGKLFG